MAGDDKVDAGETEDEDRDEIAGIDAADIHLKKTSSRSENVSIAFRLPIRGIPLRFESGKAAKQRDSLAETTVRLCQNFELNASIT